jgi:hypothetical protein
VVRSAAAALVVLVSAGGASAQAPGYAAGQLACARFVERADADIQGEAGGRTLIEKGGRYGRWIVRGVPAGD